MVIIIFFHGITQWFNLANKKIEIAVGCMCWIMGRKWKFVPVVEELFLNKDGTEKLRRDRQNEIYLLAVQQHCTSAQAAVTTTQTLGQDRAAVIFRIHQTENYIYVMSE